MRNQKTEKENSYGTIKEIDRTGIMRERKKKKKINVYNLIFS